MTSKLILRKWFVTTVLNSTHSCPATS